MRRDLIVMRHAKAASAEPGAPDRSRPLSARGQRDAPLIAERLVDLGWIPERVLCSSAQRTQETWVRMADRLGEIPVDVLDALYLADADTLRQGVAGLPASVTRALILGHNPGLEDFLSALLSSDVVLTTGNAALLRGEGSTWAEGLTRGLRLVTILRPRDLS